jgi:hypothetical protein
MKKKICGAVIMAAIALVSGWNISRSTSETTLSDVALVNVEALAQETVYIYCRPAYVWVCNQSIPLYGEPIRLNSLKQKCVDSFFVIYRINVLV